MLIAADLHIHSRYSRATSSDLTLPNLAFWAKRKGIAVVGTGDFTHPKWREEMRSQLREDGTGLLQLQASFNVLPAVTAQAAMFSANAAASAQENFLPEAVRFVLTTELSTIYTENGKTRKVHHVFLAPDLDTIDRISHELERRKFNIASDGRPILGMTSKELCALIFDINPRSELIPAHIWTPWFSVFGSKSGYDTLAECYGEFTPKILALETGLSSDPPMNWRLSALDKYTLVSNSDAHSASKLGREANVFDVTSLSELTYDRLVDWIRRGNTERFKYTIEFFPEEGKYHYDGHRACGICWAPQETKAHGGICPVCGNPLTLGVCYRVDDLADRPAGFQNKARIGFRSTVPLSEVIGAVLGVGPASAKVQRQYDLLVDGLGSEFAVLLEAAPSAIAKLVGEPIAAGIIRMRRGDIELSPGYDGEFGKVMVKG